MRQTRRCLTPVVAILAMIAALLSALPLAAQASESIPTTQYPPIPIGRYSDPVAGPDGSVTLPCNNLNGGNNLVTYSATGALVRQLDRTQFVDGVANCLTTPVVDKNNVVYGIANGRTPSGSYATGQYLYAFAGNTLKWKYPLQCGSSQPPSIVVGANGNIYGTVQLSDGVHLVGVAPELTPGQTQPAKVLDVKLPNDCTIQLQAYRDGVMAHGQLSGNARYYSYAGKFLGQASIGDIWYEKMNAEGELFVAKYVSGSGFKSTSISKYDPLTGTVLWTAAASTPGADTSGISLYPLPNGGVTAHVVQQRMTADGLPATPKEWQSTLVTLNAAGQKLYTAILPSKSTQGTVYSHAYTTADASGRITTLQHMDEPTGLSYPSTVAAIAIRVYDPATNTWPYQNAIRGDMAKPGGPYGYFLDAAPAVTANAVIVIGKCSGNCAGERKLFAVKVSSLGMEYPRGLVITTPPRPQYLALGDSFSSGESVKPFKSSTDIPGVNQCHRSNIAYSRLIAGSSPKIPYLGADGFRACAGAVSENIWTKEEWNEGIQLDLWPNMAARIVTVTIGGNDVKFGTFATACVKDTCQKGSKAYNDTYHEIENTLPAKLEVAYKRILQFAPNATVYVVGYPQIIAPKLATDPFDIRCAYMYNPGSNTTYSPYFPWEDVWGARDIVEKLNTKISNVVNNLRMNAENLRLHYIPVDGSTSIFKGHEICGQGDSWFQNIDQAVDNSDYVFHPNAKGQSGYASVIKTELEK